MINQRMRWDMDRTLIQLVANYRMFIGEGSIKHPECGYVSVIVKAFHISIETCIPSDKQGSA